MRENRVKRLTGGRMARTTATMLHGSGNRYSRMTNRGMLPSIGTVLGVGMAGMIRAVPLYRGVLRAW